MKEEIKNNGLYITSLLFVTVKLFNQPFPQSKSKTKWAKTGASFGLFVFVFMIVFKPFELDKVSFAKLFEISALLGVIAFACYFFSNIFLNYFFPSVCNEENWTAGKQIIKISAILFLVGLANCFAFVIFYGSELSFKTVYQFQLRTISVGLLPIIIFTLLAQNLWLKKFKVEATELQKKLAAKKEIEKSINNPRNNSDQQVVSFESESKKDTLSVPLNQLYYIEAASNYAKIYYEQAGTLSYSIIRMTMKKAGEIADEYTSLFKCHRAYIVNLDKVKSVDGNAQGYKLTMNLTEKSIPVSRSLNNEFSDRLLAIQRNM